jgi:16S rRNA (guanine1207-N2)-methyltransferase
MVDYRCRMVGNKPRVVGYNFRMGEQYFSAEPSSELTLTPVHVSVWGHQLDLVTGSGVFANGRLDRGTAVLFRESEPPTSAGTFLDLGCGYGVIACALAVAVPGSRVIAVDVNYRALDLTRMNAERNRVADQITVAHPDEVPDDLRFDEIWSNPPIRVGKTALHDLLLTWLGRLVPEIGVARLVVGKNLGSDSLQRWLTEQGYPTQRLGSAKGFRVLRAVNAST